MIDTPKYVKIRLFIAIDLPLAITEELRGIQGEFKLYPTSQQGICSTKVSWVKPENIHLTIKFLGDVKQERLGNILHTIKEAVSSYTPISLSVEGLGCFPNIASPRVLWIGIKSDGESLLSLQKIVERSLELIGFKKEKRRFHPHLTLGRIRSLTDREGWKEMVNRFKDITLGTFEVDRIVLYRSDLNPKGAVYTRLGEAVLNGLHS